jgi:hypothetical protein
MSGPLEQLNERLAELDGLADNATLRKGYRTFRLLRDTRALLHSLDLALDVAAVKRDETLRLLGEAALGQPETFRVTSPFEFAETMATVASKRSELETRSNEIESQITVFKAGLEHQVLEQQIQIDAEIATEASLSQKLDSLSDDECDVQTMTVAKERLETCRARHMKLLQTQQNLSEAGRRKLDELRSGLAQQLELVVNMSARAEAVQRDLGRAVLESDSIQTESQALADARASLAGIHELRRQRTKTLEYFNTIDDKPLNLLIKRGLIAFSVSVGLLWIIAH